MSESFSANFTFSDDSELSNMSKPISLEPLKWMPVSSEESLEEPQQKVKINVYAANATNLLDECWVELG